MHTKSILYIATILFLLSCKSKNNTQILPNDIFDNLNYEQGELNKTGTYSGEDDRVLYSITIIGDTWFGEHTEKNMGFNLASGNGTIEDNKIIDENGLIIGEIYDNVISVLIGSKYITLTKNKYD
ncbi:MAG TPA: hypothetical protein PLC61_07820 [Chitinophagales bacterium]|jgi:hypothetical protein|nr:hypothetical protein [Chitinophagales bacterium]MCO5112366.1 hypothetical protein [Burkholderiaceae bacterium]MCO5261194.1 hypothetical protein [Crocinitomicaceae bacterium]MCO5282257.1 hypothetical protein [Saprospiraceae bacterium]HMZ94901.1 hypothetical protein [Chitinophagales bacterium]